MQKSNSISRRFISLLLCLSVIASLYMGFPVISNAATTVTVITGADYQPSSSTQPYSYSEAIMKGIKNAGIKPYGALFSGDYSGGFSASASTQGINDLKSLLKANFGTVSHQIFSQGNHDPAATSGLTSSGAHDTQYYGVYVLNDDDYGWFNGDPNNMSDGMGGNLPVIQAKADDMRSYFTQKAREGYDKPIFITSHIPLHNSYRTRTYNDGQYARYIVDVLNEAGAAGLNVIYLFGHNHSAPSDDYIGGGSVFLTRGDSMFVSQIGNATATPVQVPLNFTYMNSGYLGYCANSNPGGNILNMAVFEITGNEVIVKRCSANGLVPVGAQCAWWSSVESAATYGTTDAYLKPATGLTEKLTANYNGWNLVDTTATTSTVYSLASSLKSGSKYVIVDSNKAGSALAVKYASGVTGTKSVTVKTGSGGTTLSGVTSDIVWTWSSVSDLYGVFKGSGGRYLQIDGFNNGVLRTSSDYKQTDSGKRYSMWRMSSSPSNGMYAYVYGSSYSGTDTRSYLRSNGNSMLSVGHNNLGSTTTKPVYIYEKKTVTNTAKTWAKVEGVTNYGSEPLYFTSVDSLMNLIRLNLVVTVKNSAGKTTTTNDFTLGNISTSKNGYRLVPVYYKDVMIGAVTFNVNNAEATNRLKALTYNSTFYANAQADVKAAYGTNTDLLWSHFVHYGIKEGRRANPVFDMRYYASNNSYVKNTFGTDYKAIMEYYVNIGYKEVGSKAAVANLGNDFEANIRGVGSGKNIADSNASVVLANNSSSTTQIWRFVRQTDGSYKIINKASGRVLDVYAASNTSGTKVQTYASNDTNAQRWFIYKTSNGYVFMPKSSTVGANSTVLDVYAGASTAGTALQIYTYNETSAQKFNVVVVDSKAEPEGLGTGFYANISVGSMSVGVSGTNVQLVKTSKTSSTQTWKFELQADGTYKITHKATGKVLDVYAAQDANFANVQIYDSNNTKAQRWYVIEYQGKYVLRSAASSTRVLDVYAGNIASGTNVDIYTRNNTAAQLFTITKV